MSGHINKFPLRIPYDLCSIIDGIFQELEKFDTWSAWKVVLTLVCLPLLIVFMVLGGMMALALPLLVVVGIVAIIVSIFK